MTHTFPPAQPRHFTAMLTSPNRKKMFVVCQGGEMLRVEYLYPLLRRDDTTQALFIIKYRYWVEVVSFTISELKEYRAKNK